MIKKTHPRLAVLGQLEAPKERADAAENRRKILAAARRLLKQKEMGEICMNAVAGEAGVGKGTVYRRFPDRTALCFALLDESARALQEQVLAGFDLPADATAIDRVLALLGALFDFVFDNAPLLSEAWAAHKGGPDRFEHPGHAWQRQALAIELERAIDAGLHAEVEDVSAAAELLLIGLHPDLVRWLYERLGDRARVRASFLESWRGQLGLR